MAVESRLPSPVLAGSGSRVCGRSRTLSARWRSPVVRRRPYSPGATAREDGWTGSLAQSPAPAADPRDPGHCAAAARCTRPSRCAATCWPPRRRRPLAAARGRPRRRRRRDRGAGLPVFEVRAAAPPDAQRALPARRRLRQRAGPAPLAVRRPAGPPARGQVVLPAYPLTPTHTWQDALPPLLELFDEVAAGSPHGVVLMGDSAGGGLAVGLAQRWSPAPGAQPTHLVAFAPVGGPDRGDPGPRRPRTTRG